MPKFMKYHLENYIFSCFVKIKEGSKINIKYNKTKQNKTNKQTKKHTNKQTKQNKTKQNKTKISSAKNDAEKPSHK